MRVSEYTHDITSDHNLRIGDIDQGTPGQLSNEVSFIQTFTGKHSREYDGTHWRYFMPSHDYGQVSAS